MPPPRYRPVPHRSPWCWEGTATKGDGNEDGSTSATVNGRGGHRPGSSSAIPLPPRGWARLLWLGPGFLWMVSAAGSGELLFTPRIGALYGYALVWAMLLAVTLKWFINREIGRYTVCTGRTLLDGFRSLPGPPGWALYLIIIPQLFVAVATIAGLGGSAATALTLALPGNTELWAVAGILASMALVVWGRYKGVERVAMTFAVILALTSVVAAVSVTPDPRDIAAGAVPQEPEEGLDYGEILPWLGFMLSGAAGMIWYSYWVRAKGYGAARKDDSERPPDPRAGSDEDRARLRGWIGQMTLDNSVAVVGTLVITLAFLILGAELLRPEGLVPEEDRVADVLGELLGGIWGRAGYWFMVCGVFIGFWDTVLSDQDGFGRMFADGARGAVRRLGLGGRWRDDEFLRQVIVIVLLTVMPVALFLVVGEPVGLLKAAGAIEAAHIPVLAGLTLYLNRQSLPADLRASWLVFAATVIAGLFFAAFAVFYLFTL
ncbi:MAG: Nramp family divalent metal transporter [Dehalococcoidia bacterium]|nr:Nramp family divalent metal transporter [Dehalococcoidia bacterium]